MAKKTKEQQIHNRAQNALKKSLNEAQIRKEYKEYLDKEGESESLEQADQFAIKKTHAGEANHWGFTEREIILMIAGELPERFE